jgi:hypothetical protein
MEDWSQIQALGPHRVYALWSGGYTYIARKCLGSKDLFDVWCIPDVGTNLEILVTSSDQSVVCASVGEHIKSRPR